MAKPGKQDEEYDSPWKTILGIYFRHFTELFFPDIAAEIDWERGYVPLDKELERITREAEVKEGLLADRLFKVWKKNGDEAWVLAHVEVQAQKKKTFPHRTFVYNYRIHDLYKRPVASLVVLADDNSKWRPSSYSHELWKCKTEFSFRMVKLLDYKRRTRELEASDNPFAVVVRVHLKTLETKRDSRSRRRWKVELTKALYDRGFERDDIINLYRFIDWIMVLPRELEEDYQRELAKFEEERKMQYVTTAERIGLEKGTLIGQILMAQEMLGRQAHSPEDLREKRIDELKGIFEEEHAHVRVTEPVMEKGRVIGEILMAQRMLGHQTHSPEELRTREMDDLRRIFERERPRVTAVAGMERGKLIGEILMAQRILGESAHSEKTLEAEETENLKEILRRLEAKLN